MAAKEGGSKGKRKMEERVTHERKAEVTEPLNERALPLQRMRMGNQPIEDTYLGYSQCVCAGLTFLFIEQPTHSLSLSRFFFRNPPSLSPSLSLPLTPSLSPSPSSPCSPPFPLYRPTPLHPSSSLTNAGTNDCLFSSTSLSPLFPSRIFSLQIVHCSRPHVRHKYRGEMPRTTGIAFSPP